MKIYRRASPYYVPRRPKADRYARAARIAILAVVVVFLAIALPGCAKRTQDDGSAHGPAAYQDRATGCEYLAIGRNSNGSLTPRIAADGKTHVGCKRTQQQSTGA